MLFRNLVFAGSKFHPLTFDHEKRRDLYLTKFPIIAKVWFSNVHFQIQTWNELFSVQSFGGLMQVEMSQENPKNFIFTFRNNSVAQKVTLWIRTYMFLCTWLEPLHDYDFWTVEWHPSHQILQLQYYLFICLAYICRWWRMAQHSMENRW